MQNILLHEHNGQNVMLPNVDIFSKDFPVYYSPLLLMITIFSDDVDLADI